MVDYVKERALIKAEVWRRYFSTYLPVKGRDNVQKLEYDITKIGRWWSGHDYWH